MVCPTLSCALSFSVTVKLAYSCDRSVNVTICVPAVRILPYLDVADAEFAIEWSADQFLRNDRLGPGDPGIGLVIRRLRLIDGRLRSELARGQLLGPVQRQLRHRGLCLEARQIRLLGSIEQLHQRVSGLHIAIPAVNMMSVMRPLTSEVTLT